MMKLTALKMSRQDALFSGDSGKRTSREGRVDVAALVGAARVGVTRLGVTVTKVGVPVTRVGVTVIRVGGTRVDATSVGVTSTRAGVGVWNGGGSCKGGKGESRDDFELHIILFFLL